MSHKIQPMLSHSNTFLTILHTITTLSHACSYHITIISGEISGDQYAADLIQQIHSQYPNCRFSGISGTQAQTQGLHIWPNCQPKKIMGFMQALQYSQHYRCLLASIKKQLSLSRPHLLILIDYGGLNLRVAKISHQLNIPVLYYIPPKVWAWGTRRLRKVQQYVTRVAPIYPFEHDFFNAKNVPSTLAQHPFLAKIPNHKANANLQTIALLPGSRHQEIATLLPLMLKASYQLLQQAPQCQFQIFCAEPSHLAIIERYLMPWKHRLPIQVIMYQHIQKLRACGSALVCSGTATFECAMLKVPMVVIYRCHWLNYLLIKCLIRIPWISLPNLILQSCAVPELLQSRCRANLMTYHLRQLIHNSPARTKQVNALEKLHAHMTSQKPVQSIAQIILKMLSQPLTRYKKMS